MNVYPDVAEVNFFLLSFAAWYVEKESPLGGALK